jgi:hypothetical protein
MVFVIFLKLPYMRRLIFLTILLFCLLAISAQDNKVEIYRTETGHVNFVSDAPLELISAESKELKGAVDPEKLTFAFQLDVRSLKGFNSPLQQEHFYENYIESEKFPVATFSGKIIEKVNFKVPGTIPIRAKGILKIHGVEQERIISCTLTIHKDGFRVDSEFIVPLADYDISIPKLVYQKIAEEIKVTIQADLSLKESQ